METKYTRVTCVACNKQRRTFDSDLKLLGAGTLDGWYSLQLQQESGGGRAIDRKTGFCSLKCLEHAQELADPEKRNDEYIPIEKITEWK